MGNSYTEDHFMNIFLDKFHREGKYNPQTESHQEYLISEGKVTDQNYLSVSSLQTNYLNLHRSSGSGRNNEIENLVQVK